MKVKTPETIAAEIVGGLSFTSNRMREGKLVGEQHFAAEAIATALAAERATTESLRRALVESVIALNGLIGGRLVRTGRVAKAASKAAMDALNALDA